MAIDMLDDFVEGTANLEGGAAVEGAGGEAGKVWAEARGLWLKVIKSDLIEETIANARTRAAGFEAGLRNEFSKLWRNKREMKRIYGSRKRGDLGNLGRQFHPEHVAQARQPGPRSRATA